MQLSWEWNSDLRTEHLWARGRQHHYVQNRNRLHQPVDTECHFTLLNVRVWRSSSCQQLLNQSPNCVSLHCRIADEERLVRPLQSFSASVRLWCGGVCDVSLLSVDQR